MGGDVGCVLVGFGVGSGCCCCPAVGCGVGCGAGSGVGSSVVGNSDVGTFVVSTNIVVGRIVVELMVAYSVIDNEGAVVRSKVGTKVSGDITGAVVGLPCCDGRRNDGLGVGCGVG